MNWSHPEYLWLLLLVPMFAVALWGWARHNRNKRQQYFSDQVFSSLMHPVWKPGQRARLGAQCAGVILLIIALAGPQFGTEAREVQRRGVNLMVALDLSRSMLAEDVSPNRLDKARFELYHLLSQLSGDRIGLITFTDQAIVQTPLTQDYSTFRMYLDMAEPGLLPSMGTDFRAPLSVAVESFREVSGRDAEAGNVLLIVSDGEDHGPGVSEELAQLEELGVYVYTVGIGTEDGSYLPTYDDQTDSQIDVFRDRDGNVVTTHLEPQVLQQMAGRTGGEYIEITHTSHSMEGFINQIGRHERASFTAEQQIEYRNRYQIPAAIGTLLLFLSLVIPTHQKPIA